MELQESPFSFITPLAASGRASQGQRESERARSKLAPKSFSPSSSSFSFFSPQKRKFDDDEKREF